MDLATSDRRKDSRPGCKEGVKTARGAMIGTVSPSTREGAPMDRNAYIESLKSQLDKWNTEMVKWEG